MIIILNDPMTPVGEGRVAAVARLKARRVICCMMWESDIAKAINHPALHHEDLFSTDMYY